MTKTRKPQDIDGYISQFPADVQAILEHVRKTICKAAPDAKEAISYQMPAFKQHGILVYFAAWKNHIGLYPPIFGDKTLEKAVARYAGPKGNLQFPLDEPIPYNLIEKIVKLRMEQDFAKAAKRKTTKAARRKSPCTTFCPTREAAMPFTMKQMDTIRSMEQSPQDCLVCGGRACLVLVAQDMERIEETGRVDLRCGKCGLKLTITA